jgi:hypothetical protein
MVAETETEVLGLIDKAIALCSGREIISTNEMVDLLLDIRLAMPTIEEREIA